MLPIFFGDPKEALFGIYHPPKQARSRPMSAVLCHPFGNEYVGAYRTMRILAEKLSAEGIAVLRFDYFGTGDSMGSGTESSFEHWLSDIDAAIEEVQGASDATQTSLIGLRLGGALAALAAAPRNDIDRVVMWEPVLIGQDHINLHLERHNTWLQDVHCPTDDSTSTEVLGHPLTEQLRRELAELDVIEQTRQKLDGVSLVFHSEDRQQNESSLSQLGDNVEQHVISSTDFWLGHAGFDQPMVSTEVIQSIVAWLTGEAR